MFKRYYLVRKHDNYKEERVINMINPEDLYKEEKSKEVKEFEQELADRKERDDNEQQSVG